MKNLNQALIESLPAEKVPDVSDEIFIKIAKYLKNLTGITLENSPKNKSLVQGRLNKIIGKDGITSYQEVIKLLDSSDRSFIKIFISAMTTNTTEFFRENSHFIYLNEIIPQILEKKIKSSENELRVWCAACSTGQEIYSLAITLNEALADKNIKLKLLASDIDIQVLRTANAGVYSASQILSSVPPHLINKYFNKGINEQTNQFIVKDEIKSQIRFLILNLIDRKYPFQHKFDIIFCRNVLIYFDESTVNQVISSFLNNLNNNGYLFLGHSEGRVELHKGLSRVSNTVYQYKK